MQHGDDSSPGAWWEVERASCCRNQQTAKMVAAFAITPASSICGVCIPTACRSEARGIHASFIHTTQLTSLSFIHASLLFHTHPHAMGEEQSTFLTEPIQLASVPSRQPGRSIRPSSSAGPHWGAEPRPAVDLYCLRSGRSRLEAEQAGVNRRSAVAWSLKAGLWDSQIWVNVIFKRWRRTMRTFVTSYNLNLCFYILCCRIVLLGTCWFLRCKDMH